MSEPTIGSRLSNAALSSRSVRFLDRNERAETLSYADIHTRALRIAGGLEALGLRPGDRAAIILPTSPRFYDAFFGAILAGVIPVPLYPPVRLGRLEEFHARTTAMVEACGARIVLTENRIRRLLGETIERSRPALGCIALDDFEGCETEAFERGPDDVAFIQFSSGTTRAPKPVALTHRQILANVRAIMATITKTHPTGSDASHVGVSWLPLYHDMGLVGAVLSAVDHPGDLVLIPPELFVTRPSIWLRAISRYRGTISPAPNFAYALCADRIRDEELEGVDLSSWRVALNGAEPVTPGVLQRFVERFRPYGLREEALTPVYGLAEATLAVTFSDVGGAFRYDRFDRDSLTRKNEARPAPDGLSLVSVGRPLPGFSVRVTDDLGTPLRAGRIGRVRVRGPSIMAGYFGMEEATEKCLPDGWLDTGDTGFLHGGELYLFGRAKDLIVIRGRNHAPQDIEQAADEVPGVRRGCCAAVGILSESADGEALLLLVERARTGACGDDEELAERVRGHVNAVTGLRPDHVKILEPGTLPRTSSGKIRRSEARRRCLAGELHPPARIGAVRLAGAMMRSSLGFARARRAH
jgi:acyl-CoA synthetase (AMP-forming)/AMP-acid ligase II